MRDKNDLPRHLRNTPSKFDYLKEAYLPSKTDTDKDGYKHLGNTIEWKGGSPKEYRHCQLRKRKHKHILEEKNLGRCYKEFACPICKIKWTVDSSD